MPDDIRELILRVAKQLIQVQTPVARVVKKSMQGLRRELRCLLQEPNPFYRARAARRLALPPHRTIRLLQWMYRLHR